MRILPLHGQVPAPAARPPLAPSHCCPLRPPPALPEHLPQAGPRRHKEGGDSPSLVGNTGSGGKYLCGDTRAEKERQPEGKSPICRWRKLRLIGRKWPCPGLLLGRRRGFLEDGGEFPALDIVCKSSQKSQSCSPHSHGAAGEKGENSRSEQSFRIQME